MTTTTARDHSIGKPLEILCEREITCSKQAVRPLITFVVLNRQCDRRSCQQLVLGGRTKQQVNMYRHDSGTVSLASKVRGQQFSFIQSSQLDTL
jgi:hypothetical protein